MADLVKLDATVLESKVLELEAKMDTLTLNQLQMPDDIKQKLKDVLTWVISNL